MLTLLTLAGMFGSLSSSTPQISYTTKMDTWIMASVIFVFITLLELVAVLVYKMYLNDQKREETNFKGYVYLPRTGAHTRECTQPAPHF